MVPESAALDKSAAAESARIGGQATFFDPARSRPRKIDGLDSVPRGRGAHERREAPVYNPTMAVVYEHESPAAPRSGLGPYRAGDYFQLPDEPRCELLYGRLLVTPAPTFRHGEIVRALGELLGEHSRRRGGRAAVSPVDVVLSHHSIVQPDLVYVSRERCGIVGERVDGPPDLVVEVLSPATARRDLGEKLRLYAEAGVAEYWIVDPAARTFEFLENRESAFLLRLPEQGVYRSAAVPGLELDLEAFWRELPEPPAG
jgi:Uma2 family endonuclease